MGSDGDALRFYIRGHVHMMSAQGGGTPKADAVRKLSKGGCVKIQTRGGRGSKNPKILQTSYVLYMPPLAHSADKDIIAV